MLFIILASLIFVFLIGLSVYHQFGRRGRLRAKIPGPRFWPIIGNSHNLICSQEKLFQYLRTLPKTYGNVVTFGALDIIGVNIYNPDDIETILSSNKFIEKREPYIFLANWLGEGLLVSNGVQYILVVRGVCRFPHDDFLDSTKSHIINFKCNKWFQRRKMLTPAFHFNILKKFFRTFEEETQIFLNRVETEVGKEKTDIDELVSKMTLRTVCKSAMGTMSEDIESVSNVYMNAIHKLGAEVSQRICKLWLYFDFTYQFSQAAYIERKVLKDLHGFTRNVIQERKGYLRDNPWVLDMDNYKEGNKKGRLAMLDLLIQHDNAGVIDDEGIREEVDTFMFRGHDTTSSALMFLFMRLANEPVIQGKIHEEIKSIFGSSDRPPTTDDIKEMKYLDCCIKESLRMYPSVHYIARFVKEEVELGGYVIPENTIIQIFIYDLHHDPDLYPEPDRFIPERFLSENSANRHPYAYLPFSAGPRNCIGQKFAMLEMKTLVCGLLRKYRLEPVTKCSDVSLIGDLVLRAKHPIYVRFRSRQ